MNIIKQHKIYIYGELYIIDEYDNGDFHSLSYNVCTKSLENTKAILKEFIEFYEF